MDDLETRVKRGGVPLQTGLRTNYSSTEKGNTIIISAILKKMLAHLELNQRLISNNVFLQATHLLRELTHKMLSLVHTN